MTFDTKLTMALAGCSGSCSANRWHTLSVALPCFRATNPKTLQQERWVSMPAEAHPSHMVHASASSLTIIASNYHLSKISGPYPLPDTCLHTPSTAAGRMLCPDFAEEEPEGQGWGGLAMRLGPELKTWVKPGWNPPDPSAPGHQSRVSGEDLCSTTGAACSLLTPSEQTGADRHTHLWMPAPQFQFLGLRGVLPRCPHSQPLGLEDRASKNTPGAPFPGHICAGEETV